MRLRWTESAVSDLQNIYQRIRRDRRHGTAVAVCRKIHTGVQTLRRHPAKGRIGAVPGTRELSFPAPHTSSSTALPPIASRSTVSFMGHSNRHRRPDRFIAPPPPASARSRLLTPECQPRFLKRPRRRVLIEVPREWNLVSDLRLALIHPRLRNMRLHLALEIFPDVLFQRHVLCIAQFRVWLNNCHRRKNRFA